MKTKQIYVNYETGCSNGDRVLEDLSNLVIVLRDHKPNKDILYKYIEVWDENGEMLAVFYNL